jgi:hypothetical protein
MGRPGGKRHRSLSGSGVGWIAIAEVGVFPQGIAGPERTRRHGIHAVMPFKSKAAKKKKAKK